MKKLTTCGLVIAALLVAGCGGGAGGAGNAVVPTSPGGGSTSQSKSSMTFTIQIPTKQSQARRPGFVSPGTLSLGIVETDQGATAANPAVFVNVSSCPSVSGVVTCSANVPATPGLDTFVITSYSAANGGGNVLGSGSLQYQIQPGVNNTTTPLTINGAVASITLTPQWSAVPLGQTVPMTIVAKDASGAVIAGTFSNAPITLSGANVWFSKNAIKSSGDLAGVQVGWNHGYQSSWGSTTITATTADNATGTTTVEPATGVAMYDVGSTVNDITGFKSVIGPDGNLYFTSLGVVICSQSTNICAATQGAVHQYNLTTGATTEVALPGEGVGLAFDSNGTLWIAGGVSNSVYYMPNAAAAFSAAGLQTLALPANVSANIRAIAQDNSTNMWAVDVQHRLIKIPMTNPTTGSVVTYPMPKGRNGWWGQGFGIFYSGGSMWILDRAGADVDQFNLGTLAFGTQTALPWNGTDGSGDVSHPYDYGVSGSILYTGQDDSYNAPFEQGGIATFNAATLATTKIAMPASVVNGPGSMSVNGNVLYYNTFDTNSAIGTVNLTTGAARTIPSISTNYADSTFPNRLEAVSDGTAWGPCYTSGLTPQPPLCVEHTIYTNGWSVWPGATFNINGSGSQNEQLIGIMEAPTVSSAPFTVTSSNTSICAVVPDPSSINDHNFNIVGQAAGSCTLTVTDKNSVSRTIQVTVTTTSGTIQGRHAKTSGGIL